MLRAAPAGRRLDSARLTLIQAQSFASTGRTFQTMETLETSKESRPTWSQVDFLASHTVSPGSEEARQMTVRSGLKCCELFRSQDRVGCLLRTCMASSIWNSTVCFLTWKPSVTPQGRLLFRLAPSMPDTDETGYGLWPTPSASEDAAGTINGNMQFMLTHAVKLADPAKAAAGWQLNPQWVDWLMGYPIGWTALSASEMPSSRRSRRKSSR